MIALALWRFLRRTPWSLLMALLGVALGVTSIVSVHLISERIARQLDDLIPQELAAYSHFLHRDDMTADHYFELRQRWLAAGPGHALARVNRVSPIIDETAVVSGQLLRVVGIDLLAGGSLARLQADDDAAAQAFSWQGIWVDEGVPDGLPFHINGTLPGSAGLILADIGTAQRLLAWDAGEISYIGVHLSDPLARLKDRGEALLPGFGAGLPAADPALADFQGYSVLSLAQQHPASQFGKSVLFNVSALGLLAMLVAWFLIYQVAVSWLRRLWPVFERLHALGVAWAELYRYFAVALCALGGIACVLGLWLGHSLAQWLLSAVAAAAAQASLPLSSWVVAKAAGSALGVCFLGGLWAFRQARQDRPSGVSPLWASSLVVLAVLGVVRPESGLWGGFLSIAVCSVLAVLLSAPLLRYLRRRAHRIGGPYLARLSVREAVWYPQDLAVALSGLALAVATAIGMGLMVDSFREDFASMLERRLSYDLVVRGSHEDLYRLAAAAADMPAVSRVQSYAQMDIRVHGAPVQLVAARMDRVETRRYGLDRALGPDDALLSEQGARLLGMAVGDTLSVGSEELVVAGVFASFGDLQARLLVDRANPLAQEIALLRSVSLNTAAPQPVGETLAQRYPGIEVEQQSELRRTALQTFDQTFVITTVLIFIALLVAAIGVYVAVTTLRLNRRTSTQLMAGLGLNRYEDVGMDFALGLGIGIVAMLVAIPLGTVLGWILCAVINPRAFGWTVTLQLNWQSYLQPLVWGLAAAAVAGVIRVGRNEGRPSRGIA